MAPMVLEILVTEGNGCPAVLKSSEIRMSLKNTYKLKNAFKLFFVLMGICALPFEASTKTELMYSRLDEEQNHRIQDD